MTWLHRDHLGSASVATDNTAAAASIPNSETCYKPYGERRVPGSGLPSKWTFAGGYDFVASTGLLEFGAGQYDPYIGRFLSADTIVPHPGDPQSFNRYAYARNSPLSRIDPSGHADGIIENIGGFIYGFTAGLAEANSPYIPTSMQQSTDTLTVQESSFAAGRATGNVVGIAQGLAEIVAGGSADVGGGGLCATGAGCVLGAPALVVGTAIATHGLAVAANGVMKLGNTATLMAKGQGKSSGNTNADEIGEHIHRLENGITSVEENIAEHEAKLDAYRQNPDASDNKQQPQNSPLKASAACDEQHRTIAAPIT